jgi:hypothetical protein
MKKKLDAKDLINIGLFSSPISMLFTTKIKMRETLLIEQLIIVIFAVEHLVKNGRLETIKHF